MGGTVRKILGGGDVVQLVRQESEKTALLKELAASHEAHYNDLSEQLQKIQVRCPVLFLCSLLRGGAGGWRGRWA
eukprot:SAG11_NODE_5878_length_1442_cov_4.145942_1_plen_74_part_10